MIIASIPKRVFATIIDLAIFIVLFLLIYFAVYIDHQIFQGQSGSGYVYEMVNPTGSVYLTVLISWIVFIILTEFKRGQSIGKRLIKIKVVRQDLSKATFVNISIRHLFDLIDIVLLIGLLVALANKNQQRIGDILAKTIVVTK
jgi:uncharacterized RDD family membrane protein YckC